MVLEMKQPTSKRIALAVFFLMPAVLVASLMWYFALTRGNERLMNVPPVGAGAGATAGANAIGELLAGNRANHSLKAPQPATEPAPAAAQPKLIRAEEWDGGVLLIVEDKSKKASSSKPMYFASIITGWVAGDPRYKMDAQSDGRWRIKLPKPDRGVDFKFTLGTWDEVEQTADGKDVDNRMLPQIDVSKLKPDEPAQIELVVANFKVPKVGDVEPYRTLAATGEIRRLPVRGGGGAAKNLNRDALIWLPPGYNDPANATRTYPVIYMFDGQNLFEKSESAPGEWGMDEIATNLINNKAMEPTIIVGLQHAGSLRTSEYVPPVTTEAIINNQTPAGGETLAWVMNTVMPRVERTFRVKAGPENTAIGGSSLGGLMALYAGATHPEVFGKILAESPALGFGKNEFSPVLFAPVKTWPSKIFMAVGGNEGGEGKEELSKQFATRVQDLNKQLAGQGLGKDRLNFIYDLEAHHNENAWNKRLPEALRFLFPPKVDATESR